MCKSVAFFLHRRLSPSIGRPIGRRSSVVGCRLSALLLLVLALGGCAPDRPALPASPIALATPTIAPTAAPTAVPARQFPQTGHMLRGAFLAFWERHDGARRLGPPRS
ncbi:MAG: hypothetical protein ACJ8CR_13520, partial [Roseiflexaceae bacterium]